MPNKPEDAPSQNPSFAGIDPDMEWLISREFVHPGEKLTSVQRKAAELLAEVLQPERVDDILVLDRGTVRDWSKDENFRRAAVTRRHSIAMRVADPVYEAALTPAQRYGAYLEARGAKRVEIAEVLGRHRSTITNWGHDPLYRRLRETYAAELRGERTLETQRRREEELELAHKAITKGLRDADSEVAGKLAVTVVKMYGENVSMPP